ncbi:tol-pal system protein YbgF [Alteromonas sp. 5E99-2]|uniref:tol-pal system protein YbgF n=1 Tax=Alteromonas sp. 5E99-2 TaxID=2817683 RepID=UPI001A9811A0|nr:tol-pal system protein YbgF [Alteromonas sp. 5E99-2]MBO1256143.1 tol-pal system protein YbgF [Alteromonas sp. 5E99-2]
MRYFIKGEALCFAFLFSTSVFAQAPVSDVNQTSAANNGAVNSTLAVSSLEERVAVLERIIKSRNVMQQSLQTQLDDMQYEVDELRGTVELHTNQLEKVLQRQRELYLEIDKRVESLKSTQIQVPTTTPTINEPIASVESQLGESESYDKAVNLILKTREYDKAIPAFREFLQAYPNSEFADNAYYWLGQLLFNKKEWADAESSFSTVVNNFADSTKRADAMLKLGVIKQNLGQGSQANVWFERVLSEYPNSSAAKLARSRQQ